MDIFIGKDITTNYIGVCIIKDPENQYIFINPKNTPNIAKGNYFFTVDKKILNDLISVKGVTEVTGGGELNLKTYETFINHLNNCMGGLIPSRTTSEKKKWYENILKYTSQIYDKEFADRYDRLLELVSDERDIKTIIESKEFSFEKGFVKKEA